MKVGHILIRRRGLKVTLYSDNISDNNSKNIKETYDKLPLKIPKVYHFLIPFLVKVKGKSSNVENALVTHES